MRKKLAVGLTLLTLSLGVFAQTKSSAKPEKSAAAPSRPACAGIGPQDNWDDSAKFIAGLGEPILLDAVAKDSGNEQVAAWNAYSKALRSDWTRLRRGYLDRIADWRAKTLVPKGSGGVAFYPFGGPDAANLLAFYPDASEYIMVGLEPYGCIPSKAEDYTPGYFADLRRSLRSVVSMGFFKTDDMRQEFRESEVHGVLPLMLVVLARYGYKVEDVATVGITGDGRLVPAESPVKKEIRGIAIRFRDDRHGVRTLRYFPVNLENSMLQRRPGTVRYLQSQVFSGTLVKSASYLMHKRYFSTIRELVLARSAMILQDDSGVPFQFLDSQTWDVRLFGTYTKPIPLFANFYQEDMKAAYTSGKGSEPLPFGIGYQWRQNESNLIAAIRRAPPN
jgi:hypothetical protein